MPELHKGPHDLDVDADRPRAAQHAGEHGDALLGEGVGRSAPAAAARLAEGMAHVQLTPRELATLRLMADGKANKEIAAALGISDGDIVEVKTNKGALTVPAILYPAIRPDVIAMPFGQGHTALGRYAKETGVNTATVTDSLTNYTPAKVSKAQGQARLIRFGTMLPEHIKTKR